MVPHCKSNIDRHMFYIHLSISVAKSLPMLAVPFLLTISNPGTTSLAGKPKAMISKVVIFPLGYHLLPREDCTLKAHRKQVIYTGCWTRCWCKRRLMHSVWIRRQPRIPPCWSRTSCTSWVNIIMHPFISQSRWMRFFESPKRRVSLPVIWCWSHIIILLAALFVTATITWAN